MTIYHVDPVNGSNANDGLSWGTAWQWPPGNGAAVAAGDEIKFAKSAERATSAVGIGRSDDLLNLTDLSYTAQGLGTNWIISITGGSSGGTGVCVCPASTTIPANTKLMYLNQSRSFSNVYGLIGALRAKNIPSGVAGTYLRIRLCSDTTGDTPVYDLEGPTWDSGNEYSFTEFLYDNATLATLSWSSVAVYSVSSFTSPATPTTIAIERVIVGTPNQATNDFLRRGEALQIDNPLAPNSGFDGTRREINVYSDDLAAAPALLPKIRSGPDRFSATTSTLTVYDALPWLDPTIYEAAITYAGASGNPIKFSGGWNTGSNTQDGFTNLAVIDAFALMRKGIFVFSSGGNYIEYSRFICLQAHLHYYDYTISAINGIKLTDCTVGVGNPTSTLYAPPAIFGAAGISGTVAVDAWYMERCVSYDWFSFGLRKSWQSGGSPYFRAYTDFSFGSVDLIDCQIHEPGTMMGGVPCPTGNVNVTSSTAGAYHSLIYGQGSNSMRLAAGATGTFSIIDTVFMVGSLDCRSLDAGAASSSAIVVEDPMLSHPAGAQDLVNDSWVSIGDYGSVTLDGYGLDPNPSGTDPHACYIHINNSAAFHTNNPGATVSVGGPVLSSSTPAATPKRFNYLKWSNPPATVDFSLGVRPLSASGDPLFVAWPGLVIDSWDGLVTVQNFEGSYAHFQSPAYQAGTYWPNVPHAEVRNSTCLVSSDLPVGLVRQIGGTIPSGSPHNGDHKRSHPFSQGVSVYGVTVPHLYDKNGSAAAPSFQDKRGFGVGVSGTLIPFGYNASTNYTNRPTSVVLEPSASLEASPSVSNSDNYGFLARKAAGWFHLRRAGVSISSSDAVNEYGKRTITMPPDSALNLARLDVLGGVTINITVRLRCLTAVTQTGHYRCSLIVPPCKAFTSALANHFLRKNFTSHTVDTILNFSVTTQKAGSLFVNLYTNVSLEIKDFTAVKV